MQALENLKKQFEDYLFAQEFDRQPQSLYQPFEYMFGLGGKRVRPMMLLAANQMFGGDVSKALPAAMAIELFHNFSLIHDDIMDKADIRRGKPSVHKAFDTNTAILSGDAMFVVAYEYLLKTGDISLIQLFNQTAKEVCEGQQFDIEFETRFDVSLDDYINMIGLKTAVLLATSLKIGAALAGATEHQQDAIYNFGKNLGISFQIKDDILDTYANQDDFGKKIGGDILQNKRTYLMLYTLEHADLKDKEAYLGLIDNSSISDKDKIKSVKKIYEKTGVRAATEEKANSFYQLSINDLIKLENEGIDASIFKDYAVKLLNRKL